MKNATANTPSDAARLRAIVRGAARTSAAFVRLAHRSGDERWARRAERLHLNTAAQAGGLL